VLDTSHPVDNAFDDLGPVVRVEDEESEPALVRIRSDVWEGDGPQSLKWLRSTT
jgi:hypothetical protein